jgi:hypothetical protein
MSFAIENKLIGKINNLNKSIYKLKKSYNSYNFLESIKKASEKLQLLYIQVRNKYYNYARLPSVLISHVYSFLSTHQLFKGQYVCKDWNNNLTNIFKNSYGFLSIEFLHDLKEKYDDFTAEYCDFILFSNNNLYKFSTISKKLSPLQQINNYNNVIVSDGNWLDIKINRINIYKCYGDFRNMKNDKIIYFHGKFSSIFIGSINAILIKNNYIRIYNFYSYQYVKKWYFDRKDEILWSYNDEKIYCTNKNEKSIEVFSFDGILIDKWKYYSKNKPFDNVITVISRFGTFYILNGNNIIALTTEGNLIFEFASPYPLIKIVYNYGYLYGYSNTHNKLIVFKIYNLLKKK